METIEIKPEKTYQITMVHSKFSRTYKKLVNQKSLDFYKKWWTGYDITIEKELEPISFDNVTITTNGPKKVGRCYVTQDYTLTSPKPLDEFSLDVLRAYGLFMGGQREGDLVGNEEVEGNFIYKLKSERDSSD